MAQHSTPYPEASKSPVLQELKMRLKDPLVGAFAGDVENEVGGVARKPGGPRTLERLGAAPLQVQAVA